MAPPADLQTVPELLRTSPGFLLGKAAQRGAELVERALAPLNLKARHYGVLAALDELGPRAQHQLGQLLRIDRTTMVAVVDHLERLGFAERTTDPQDRRAAQVRITRAGQVALDLARGTVHAADAALVSRLSSAQREHLVVLLEKLVES